MLAGRGIVDARWRWENTRPDCSPPSATIALRVEGDASAHDWRVSITYFTGEAATEADFDNADL